MIAGLTEKYRPRTIAEFVGLDKPKAILSKFAVSPFPSAWLFVGKPGLGKAAMALAIADEIGGEVHHIPSQKCTVANVEDVIRKCYYLPFGGHWHIVLADEADRMTDNAQLQLLSLLDATQFPPSTIFIFTCNETVNLEKRFLSRCRVVEFSNYGMNGAGAAFLGTEAQPEMTNSSKHQPFGDGQTVRLKRGYFDRSTLLKEGKKTGVLTLSRFAPNLIYLTQLSSWDEYTLIPRICRGTIHYVPALISPRITLPSEPPSVMSQ